MSVLVTEPNRLDNEVQATIRRSSGWWTTKRSPSAISVRRGRRAAGSGRDSTAGSLTIGGRPMDQELGSVEWEPDRREPVRRTRIAVHGWAVRDGVRAVGGCWLQPIGSRHGA